MPRLDGRFNPPDEPKFAAALAAGGTEARPPEDHGFMFGRSFNDPDGHIREIVWLDESRVSQGARRAPFRPCRYGSGTVSVILTYVRRPAARDRLSR